MNAKQLYETNLKNKTNEMCKFEQKKGSKIDLNMAQKQASNFENEFLEAYTSVNYKI